MSRKNAIQTKSRSDGNIPVFRTALYARLSVEDNGKEESDSIESQISFLESYVEERAYLQKVELYCDNGFTGTNFSRPEFNRMMDDIRRGKINCIVVKDLSRLGRNYIDTGDFIEKICPFLGVRFIAVNDGYDSENINASDELSASLKNIVNDAYAKDISRKASSALRAKRQKGEFVGNVAPYGYMKDPDNKNRLVVDPCAAAIVKQIYELRAGGMGYGSIITWLNERDIPSPGRHRFEQGIKTGRNKNGADIPWNKHVLYDILKNIVYLGHLAQGKYHTDMRKGGSFELLPEEQWDIVYNTHEPIVDEGLFNRVKEINAARKAEYEANYGKYDDLPKTDNLYRKKLICVDCKKVLKLMRSFNKLGTKAYFTYICPTFAAHGEKGCTRKRIKKEALDAAVLETIKAQMNLFLEKKELLSNLIAEARKKKAKKYKDAPTRNTLKQQLDKKNSLCVSIYSDYKDGILTKEEFLYAREKYQAEAAVLQRQLDEMDASSHAFEEKMFAQSKWSALIDQYYDAEELTREMVDVFISEIRLSADQSICVVFNFMNEYEELMKQCAALKEEIA